MESKFDFKNYIKLQTDICYCSTLYGEYVEEHGSKVLMLFAEVYSFLSNEFGPAIAQSMIVKYQNTDTFKNWFWQIKFRLGEVINKDPDFDSIGLWIGKGLFFKIIFNIIEYNWIFLTRCVDNFNYDSFVDKLVKKQKELLNDEIISNNFVIKDKILHLNDYSSYHILNEKCILDVKNPLFREINIIK